MPESVDVNKPVKVSIEITGVDLDTCLYALDIIRERITAEKTSAKVYVDRDESFEFKVENLDGKA